MPAADLALPQPYASAIKRYLALAALSPVVQSVELCGGLENPGLSDIDILLIVSDYDALRSDPILSLRLLNPESLSPLFVHGPFVCRPNEYAGFSSFTTLKTNILWRRDGFDAIAGIAPESDTLALLASQAAYVAHLSDALPQAREARHRLLLAGSVKQSLVALSPLASPTFRRSAADRIARITSLRAAWNGDSAQAEALEACEDLTAELAALIRAHLRDGALQWKDAAPFSLNDREAVKTFRRAFFEHGLGTAATPHSPPLTVAPGFQDGIGRRHAFIASLLESQLRHGVFAAGAEFPSPVPGLTARIGARIWARRLLKRAMRMIGHLR